MVCPYSYLGCRHICLRHELEEHLRSCCKFGTEKAQPPRVEDTSQYEVVCPNAILGCQHSCPREEVAEHLQVRSSSSGREPRGGGMVVLTVLGGVGCGGCVGSAEVPLPRSDEGGGAGGEEPLEAHRHRGDGGGEGQARRRWLQGEEEEEAGARGWG